MYRDEVVYPLQADLRIVRRSTIERKQMSTKTTFKRIALVAVAALGFGVLSVVPSQADVSGLIITPSNGNASVTKSDSTTAASLNIQFLALGTMDSVTVDIVAAAALPTSADITKVQLFFTESTTSVATSPTVDTGTTNSASTGPGLLVRAAGYERQSFRVVAPASANSTSSVKIKITAGETDTIKAGTYSLNAIVKSVQAGVSKTEVVPFNIVVSAATVVAAAAPVSSAATAYIQQGTLGVTGFANVLADSATSGILTAATQAGTIQVRNQSAAGVYAKDTITVTMTGVGYLTYASVTGRSFVIANVESATINVLADGASGVGTVTLATAAGASFVNSGSNKI
jgi:hypothetical protein